MTDLQEALGILKRVYQRVSTSPNLAFMVVFLTIMLLGPGLASLLIRPLSGEGWLTSATMASSVAGFVAATVFLKKRAPWLSWSGVAGLLLQSVVAALFLLTPVGVLLGYLKPSSTFQIEDLLLIAGWGACALVAAWGLIRNHWWGYFGEVLLLWALVLANFYWPGTETHTRPRSEHVPGGHEIRALGSWCVFAMLNWSLIKGGVRRWKETRGAGLTEKREAA